MFLIVLLACGPEDIGVIDMALLSVIRRWHFREGMPIREIERRTGLSRNTIRKYLRSGAVEPVFKVPARPSKLDPFAEKLTGWLRIEVGKSRKQKRTAKAMHADLVTLGFDGGYGCVAAFIRAWKVDQQREQQTSGRGTFVPLVFAPGEAFQFVTMPDAFRRLQGHLLRRVGGDREMAEILALVLQHDEQAVLCAVELALEAGVPTKTHILNLLHRLIDGKATTVAVIDAPQALRLRREPVANVARYDGLRDKGLRHAS
jgi:hypothetical protein